jgi:transposase
MQTYPSDLTDAQWALLRPYLCRRRRGNAGRPVTVDHRAIINGILYILRTGCQWRMLPHDFPPWGTVASQYYRWRSETCVISATESFLQTPSDDRLSPAPFALLQRSGRTSPTICDRPAACKLVFSQRSRGPIPGARRGVSPGLAFRHGGLTPRRAPSDRAG